MKKEQEQQSNGLENAEETQPSNVNSSQQITTNEPVKNTPFRVVGNPIQGYALTVGKNRLTDPKPTIEEAKEVLSTIDWTFIANMIIIINKTYFEIEKEQELLNQNQNKQL